MRQWLIDLRQLHGFTQAEVAKIVGIKQPYYSKIERGKQIPTTKCDIEKKIADLLGFQYTKFFEDKKESE
ncbi:MAG: helix-turn-helix domain-containing protein [Firmicutes bacterium]|nr:helix-turn-helix domain-containing protein [Bacillota bacterium]